MKQRHIWMFPKIGGPPKWMVKIMEHPIKMDDLGGNTLIFGNSHILGVGEKGVFHEAENFGS